jgi:hypothetical protein
MKLDSKSLAKIEDFIARHVADELIITPEGDKIRVKDLVIGFADSKWEVSRSEELLAVFTLKSWALAYAVARSSGDTSTANFMIKSESTLDKLTADKQLYEYHLRLAQDRRDEVKETIIDNRLSRTEYEIYGVIDDTQQVVSYQRIA